MTFLEEEELYLLNKSINYISDSSSIENFMQKLIEISMDLTKSDIGALFFLKNGDKLNQVHIKSIYKIEKEINKKTEFIDFLLDIKEIIILNNRKDSFLKDMLLNNKMNSAIAFPISYQNKIEAIAILNSRESNFYTKTKFYYIKNISDISGLMLNKKFN